MDFRCSIIVPAHNCERYIGDCIRSVLAQTVDGWELLVIDDASADRTADIAEEYAKRDPRIRVVRLESNRGAAEARNVGVRLAKYDWIALLDADDVWLPEKLECGKEAVADGQTDFVYTGFSFMSEDGRPGKEKGAVPPTVTYSKLLGGNVIVCSSVLLRRELLAGHPMLPGPWHEDFLCWLEILRSGARARGISRPLVWLRQRPTSTTANKFHSIRLTWSSYIRQGLSKPACVRYLCSNICHGIRRYFL